jgi:hypothetical protein
LGQIKGKFLENARLHWFFFLILRSFYDAQPDKSFKIILLYFMYRIFLLSFILVTGFFTACKSDPKNTANKNSSSTIQAIAGAWISEDFIGFATQYRSVLEARNNGRAPFAYALTFDILRPNQVICDNGFETFPLNINIVADTIEMKNAVQGKSIFLVYDSQSSKKIAMYDVSHGNIEISYFTKAPASADAIAYQAFLAKLNKAIIVGKYNMVKGKNQVPVSFNEDGSITGLEYNKYELCTNGDCFVTGTAIDVVSFFKENNTQPVFFGYRITPGKDKITLYELKNEKPEEKGAYTVGAPVYILTAN